MRVFISLAAAATFAAAASAQILVVPAGTDTANGSASSTYPFGRDSATASSNDVRSQDVYDSSNFTGLTFPIVITKLRYRADDTTSSWTGGSFTNCEVRIGEAGIDHASLASGNAFNATFFGGGDEIVPVYTGPIVLDPGTGNGTGAAGPWYVTINLTTPVTYDPRSGRDLVIDIKHDGVFTGTTSGAFASNAHSTSSRRMYNSSDHSSAVSNGVASNALVCELTYLPADGVYANFTASATTVFPDDVVTFTDTSYSADAGGIAAWSWDFDGDGSEDSTLQNPTWTFTSGQCGPNDVTLTVFDANDQSTVTKAAYVTVAEPIAAFTADTLSGSAPLIVNFTDTSVGASSRTWDLDGDGVFGDSTLPNPTWVYGSAAFVTVSLRAMNACGESQTSQLVRSVSGGLCTQFGGTTGWASGGFYFDVNVLNPAGITLLGLGVQIQNAGVPTTLDVYAKPGSHVGSEGDPTAWTTVATGIGVGQGSPNETVINTSDWSLPAGQWALVVHYQLPPSERFNYTSSGSTSAGNADVQLANGRMNSALWDGGTTFSPRNWNGCLYYEVGVTAGTLRALGAGCVNSSGSSALLALRDGAPAIGRTLTFDLTRGPASQPLSAVLFGFKSFGGLDLDIIGMPGCALFPNSVLQLAAPTDVLGTGVAALELPNDPRGVGLPIFAQVLAIDPGINALGAMTSQAIGGTLGAQ